MIVLLLKEVMEIRVWTHVLFSCLVFELCCVARYEGYCEDQLPLYGGGTRNDSFKLQHKEFRLGIKKTFLTAG